MTELKITELKIRVALYLRVSTEEQARNDISLAFQKARLIAYCQSKGWEIQDIYIDDGYTGKDMNRPELRRLLKDAEAKKFEVVLFWKLDRFSRRQKDLMYMIEDVLGCGERRAPAAVDIASVTENLDTTTPMGRAQIGIMIVFAQLERETIVERVQASKLEAAEQGRYQGGPVLYGYKHNPNTKSIEIDEVRAAKIRWIFEEYVRGGKGLISIAEVLNTNKVATSRKGKLWRPDTVLRIIKNPGYIGFVKHKGNIYAGRHKPIIDRDTWELAQEISKGRAISSRNTDAGLLKGIVYCGECSARVRVKNNGKGHGEVNRYFYVCYSVEGWTKEMIVDPNCPSHYFTTGHIEQKVFEQLKQYAQDPELLRRAAQDELKPQDGDNLRRMMLAAAKELEDIQRRIKKWQDAYETDAIDLEEMKERTSELKERRTILQGQIDEYNNLLNSRQETEISIEKLITTMADFETVWDNATPEERRQLLLLVVERVELFKDGNVKIKFMPVSN